MSFKTFVGDFFSNYFSLDSRIGRSLKPLFLKPGFLTNRFNEGQRKQYVHPLRLYLVVSLIFFFLLPISTNVGLDAADSDLSEFSISFSEGFTEEMMGIGFDSLQNDSTERIKQVLLDKTLSDQVVLDSLEQLQVDSLPNSWVQRKIFSQQRKILLFGLNLFISSVMKNLPVVLLIGMPTFALLLKLLYIRRKKLYVQHLIHALHLHSFSLLLFSLLTLSSLLINDWVGEDYIVNVLLLAWLIYILFSFRTVYRQPWWKTSVKIAAVGFVYVIVLAFVGAFEIVLSFFVT